MSPKRGAQWLVGLLVSGLLLFGISLFVADSQLAPPFEEAELGPVQIPAGAALPVETVLYTSDVTGTYEIYERANDGQVRALTDDPAFDSWRPRLSPDRRTILFYRSPAGIAEINERQASLWMVGTTGGVPVEILPVRSHGWTQHGGAEWSPSGNELVMMGERPTGMQIWITSVDGRDIRSLVNNPGDNFDPHWSPDTKRVLFVACPEPNCVEDEHEVFAVTVATGDLLQITNDDVLDQQPRFSPDGSQILVRSRFEAADEEGQGAVWDIRVFPTSRAQPPRRLVNDDSVSDAPVWLDNQTVLFERALDETANVGIYQVRVSDAALTELVNTGANERFPEG